VPRRLERRSDGVSTRTHCLAIYTSHSRVDDTPYYHLCELRPGHSGWHLCWCGCSFTEHGVVPSKRIEDLNARLELVASHVAL